MTRVAWFGVVLALLSASCGGQAEEERGPFVIGLSKTDVMLRITLAHSASTGHAIDRVEVVVGGQRVVRDNGDGGPPPNVTDGYTYEREREFNLDYLRLTSEEGRLMDLDSVAIWSRGGTGAEFETILTEFGRLPFEL